MAVPVWPVTLPQNPQKGYNETGGVLVVRSPMDKGPPKQRYRGKSGGMLNLTFFMTSDQFDTFEDFVNNVIRGVARFQFPHPRTETTVDVRIVPSGEGQLYQLQYLGPGFWNVTLQLEVLP